MRVPSLRYFFFFAVLAGCNTVNSISNTPGTNNLNISTIDVANMPHDAIKEWLGKPFGTLLKLKVQIYDGELLNDKAHSSDFLLKVNSIDSIPVTTAIVMEFTDETEKFPHDVFELYKYLYGKKIGTLSDKEIQAMKKKYVGREFNVVAYETGAFRGIPDGYFKYRPMVQDYGFHFNNYLVVIAGLTKTD